MAFFLSRREQPQGRRGLVVGPKGRLEMAYAVVIAPPPVPPGAQRDAPPSRPPQDVPRRLGERQWQLATTLRAAAPDAFGDRPAVSAIPSGEERDEGLAASGYRLVRPTRLIWRRRRGE